MKRSLDVLASFASDRPVQSLDEISRLLDLPKSTTHRIVDTMVEANFLERVSRGTYRLGLRSALVGLVATHDWVPAERVRRVLLRLRDETGETVGLGTLDGAEHVVLDKVRAAHPLRYDPDVGSRVPAHTSAGGKAMLAMLNSVALRRVFPREDLPRRTDRTLSTVTELRAELDRISQRGYAVDDEESIRSLRCISIGIRATNRLYSIGITVPVVRMTLQDLVDALPLIQEAASELNTVLRSNSLHDGSATLANVF